MSECRTITKNNGTSVPRFVAFRMTYRIEAAPAVNPAINKDETTPICKYSEPKSRIRIEAHKSNEMITIAVRDSGCGIARKHQYRIFERFYVVDKSRSRKLGGTGLGLAIVKHIAEVHGGYVTLESSPGAGSTFIVNLPAD